MNRNAIKKTAVCHYSKRDKCYIVESPLFDSIVGAAKTETDAWKIFHELIDATYINYLEGKLHGYEKPGRPAKGGVAFHARIKPHTKQLLALMSEELECSQGEALDYLAFVVAVNNNIAIKPPKRKVTQSKPKQGAA